MAQPIGQPENPKNDRPAPKKTFHFRLSEDVELALRLRAYNDQISLSEAANRLLARALGLTPKK